MEYLANTIYQQLQINNSKPILQSFRIIVHHRRRESQSTKKKKNLSSTRSPAEMRSTRRFNLVKTVGSCELDQISQYLQYKTDAIYCVKESFSYVLTFFCYHSFMGFFFWFLLIMWPSIVKSTQLTLFWRNQVLVQVGTEYRCFCSSLFVRKVLSLS